MFSYMAQKRTLLFAWNDLISLKRDFPFIDFPLSGNGCRHIERKTGNIEENITEWHCSVNQKMVQNMQSINTKKSLVRDT